ncbi:MAG: protease inhibitor I42 family protein [Betaproteobacteria bacterium]
MPNPMHLSIRASGALLGLVTLASCATLNRDGVVAPMEGGSVAVRQGAPLVISLPAADPTTGYGWVLTSDPGKSVWLVGGPDYTPAPVPSGMMGVGGTTTYRFRALDPGAAKLEFTYRPILEKSTPSAKVVSYDVTVTTAGWQTWF